MAPRSIYAHRVTVRIFTVKFFTLTAGGLSQIQWAYGAVHRKRQSRGPGAFTKYGEEVIFLTTAQDTDYGASGAISIEEMAQLSLRGSDAFAM